MTQTPKDPSFNARILAKGERGPVSAGDARGQLKRQNRYNACLTTSLRNDECLGAQASPEAGQGIVSRKVSPDGGSHSDESSAEEMQT